jgi:NHL repeat
MLKMPGISFGRIVLVVAALFSVSSLSLAQQAQPAITIAESSKTLSRGAVNDVPTSADLRFPSNAFAENYREFTRSKVGSSAYPEVFTLEFHVATQVAAISANHDFRVSGGTCRESQTYLAGDVCDVQVTFSPKGAGRRTGQLSIVHSASATPFLTPLGGTGYGPAVSFIPSQMATVPGTYTGTGSAAGGTLLSPQGLAVDGGDNLYIADTGNNLIKFRDSSGAITVFAGGGTASAVGYSGFGSGIKLTSPRGVAVDYSGTVFISDTGDSIVLVRYLDGIINTRIGGGSTTAGSCSYSSPCLSYNVKIQPPYGVATDSQGSVYITTQVGGSLPGFICRN